MSDNDRLLHPELLRKDSKEGVWLEGQRLQHAEGLSQPLQPETSEREPRGAVEKGNRRVDHAEAAERFIAAPLHEKVHDERLWDGRKRRDTIIQSVPEWEELRSLASAIKEHTLTHLDAYWEEFERNATKNGIDVHWAKDADEHNRIIQELVESYGGHTIIKSKSMLTEECGLREHLEPNGIEVVETDLGERIQQLDGERPSHVTGPAIHKLRSDVADLFAKKLGSDPNNTDISYLAAVQRDATRPLIIRADIGMTGANFVVAETGTFVVCTNEGNADLSANVPDVHIASIGIEKIIPRLEHLAVFVRLLARNAIGTTMTQYTSHFRGPRRDAKMHIVVVDNGRSERLGMEKFWTSLKCIRCAACLNTCPVFRRSGGLSYGATYAGPIGIILDPTFNAHKYSNLPFASTLNGSCTNVCPVKINIHEQIASWRQVLSETHELPVMKKAMMSAAGQLLSSPALYRAAISTAGSALRHLPKFMLYNRFNTWTKGRDLPVPPSDTFHSWYKKNRGAHHDQS